MDKVVITNWVHAETIGVLAPHAEVDWNAERGRIWNRSEILTRARNATALMVFMNDCVDATFLDACPDLKILAAALKGYDNFDVAACSARGIWVTNVADLLTAPTAELTIGLMIALSRNMLAGDRHIRAGEFRGWQPAFYGTGLEGSSVGLIGFGAIGQAIARRLSGFGCRIQYCDERPDEPCRETEKDAVRTDLDRLLSSSDFIVVAVPLTPATHHLIDAKAVSRMRIGSFLVNPARGSVVDEAAVAAALESGHLAGYAADVFEMEDWARGDRPNSIAPGLIDAPSATVLTPHIGSAATPVRRAIEREAAINILAALRGERPPGAVNEPVCGVSAC